ncbi:LysR family transcriptional regulator [Pseudomonas oryzihabitans]|uniref:LysR family transcriptional regulator n=1 Tax=Pseudomonas oryzihabitans TaxID=47885 RepID=UPI0011A212DD|nr:LysR family transcriptional regulator [Pseudomonas oryzihabitans]
MNSTFSHDRLDLLETFVRIVEAGSLSAAARQLGTTQPTVSRRLQALEAALQVRLVQRSTHALRLTEDGQRCYRQAQQLLGDWQAFAAALHGAHAEPEGRLRVVMPHAFGQEQLLDPLETYLRRYPGMQVDWVLSDRAPNFVADGVDCAIRVGAVEDSDTVAVRLGDVQRILVAAPDLAGTLRAPEELTALPWIAMTQFYQTELRLQLGSSGESRLIPLRARLATESLFVARHAAVRGLGCAALSHWMVREDVAAGRLVHLLPEWQATALPIYLIYPYARVYPARLRLFLELVREACARMLDVTAPA